MFYWISYITAYLLLRILFKFEITGSDNIPKKGSFILASNHCSYLDPVIIAVSIKRKLRFMAKKELFRNRFLAEFFKGLNCICLNREGVDKSALEGGIKALRKGIGLLIFPEGARSTDGKLGSAKTGVSAIAFNADTPVIPVSIKGSREILPPGRRRISFNKIEVFFGKRIYPPGIIDRSSRKVLYQEFVNTIMREVANLEKEAA